MSPIDAPLAEALPGTRFVESRLRSSWLALPVRSAVFDLTSGCVLWSPASPVSVEEWRSLGAVTDIVAPNLLHTGGVRAAAEAHPAVRLWGPPGVRDKRPELGWHGLLGVDVWPHEAELSVFPIEGMPTVREFAFLHRPSRTLYLTDLVFHVTEPVGLLTGLLLRTVGTWQRLAVSRLFLSQVRDREAFAASMAKIAALDFGNLVVAHGQVVLTDGKARLLDALRERQLIG